MGTCWGEYFTEEPEGYITEFSGNGHLSPHGPCWEPGGSLISRGLSETDEGGLWKRSISVYWSSVRRTWMKGSLTGKPEGYIKAGSRNGNLPPQGSVGRPWREHCFAGALREVRFFLSVDLT